MPKLHLSLIQAKQKAEAYRVKRAPHGFNVWRFRSWDHAEPGWRLVDQVRSAGEAEDAVLERLGLAPATDRQPVAVYVRATIEVPPEDYGWGWV